MATPLKEATVSGLAAGPTAAKRSSWPSPRSCATIASSSCSSISPRCSLKISSAAWKRRRLFSKPRCSPPTSLRWFLSATRSPSTRTLLPTRPAHPRGGAYNGTRPGFARAQTPTPIRWKTLPPTRPTKASTTISTPIANSSPARHLAVAGQNQREKVAALLFRRHLARRH